MRELLDRLAAEAGEVEEMHGEGWRTYARAGTPFAAADATAIELRLGAEIAEAARRTPDTHDSERGDDWVRFAPREWDDHAGDRLEAWFRVAWRAAARR